MEDCQFGTASHCQIGKNGATTEYERTGSDYGLDGNGGSWLDLKAIVTRRDKL